MEQPSESKIPGIEEKGASRFVVHYHGEPVCEKETWKEAAFVRMVAEKAENWDCLQQGGDDDDDDYEEESDEDDEEETDDEESTVTYMEQKTRRR